MSQKWIFLAEKPHNLHWKKYILHWKTMHGFSKKISIFFQEIANICHKTNHSRKDLANFIYKLERKVEKFNS